MKIFYSLLPILGMILLGAANAEARNCVKGKPCGNSCIAKNDVCHKTEGATTAKEETPAKPETKTEAAPSKEAAAEPAKEEKSKKAKNCKKGKPCGDSCIPEKATCHTP
jgi:hypothetical protein